MNKFFNIIIVSLIGTTLISCAGKPLKQIPPNTSFKFTLYDFPRIGKNKPSIIAGGDIITIYDNYMHKGKTIRINNYQSVIRVECSDRDGPQKKIFLCTSYKKVAGTIYDNGKSLPSTNPKEWEQVNCGLFNGQRVTNGNCAELRNQLPKVIESAFNKVEDRKREAKERLNARYDAEYKMRSLGQLRWNNRLAVKLKKGYKVCTYDKDYFGYVEDVANKRVKVYVLGKVTDYYGNGGYFFSGKNGQFNYEKIEAIRWFMRDELAVCEFKG